MKGISKGIALIGIALVASGLLFGGCGSNSSGNGLSTSVSDEPTVQLSTEGRYIIGFNGEPDPSVFTSNGGEAEIWLSSANALVGIINPDAVGKMGKPSNVKYIEKDAIVQVMGKALGKPSGGTTPPPQSLPWGVDRIDADLTWSTSTGTGVKVAVVDTGIDNSHSDFKDANGVSRVILGPTYVTGTKSSKDDNGHGTHVAGTIGASNNLIGVVGVAPSCTLVAIKVLDRNGSGYLSWVVAGIDWAANNGCKVINLSLGSTSDSQALHDAVDRAVSKGVVVVAAAGNNGDTGNSPNYPGAYSSVIAVGATDKYDQVAYFSTFGAQLDVAGPGVEVLSTWKGGGYVLASGTSMATPHVVGTCALIIAKGIPDANGDGLTNNADVRLLLEQTADDINTFSYPGWDQFIGNGLIDSQESTTGVRTLP